jgi:hypothetical protein
MQGLRLELDSHGLVMRCCADGNEPLVSVKDTKCLE